MSNNKAHQYAKIVAAALCLLLMLISLVIVSANSYAATTHQITQNSSATPTITDSSATPTITGTSATPTNTSLITPSLTITITLSPTDTPTSTPTPTPTNTPTPIPTHTPTPKPTPRPTATPTAPPATATPTATPTIAPGATPTATAKATATAQPVTTPTTNANQTPTPISGAPTTTTNNSNGGGNNNTPPTPPGSGFSPFVATITISLLVFLGLAGALLIGFTLLRRRLLPSPTPQTGNLQPSGAQPWSRTRSGSLDGTTEVQSGWNSWLLNSGIAPGKPDARTQSPSGALAQAPNQGYNMPYNMAINNALPPPTPGVYPNNAYQPIPAAPNTGVFPSPAVGLFPNNNAFSQPTVADLQSRSSLPSPNNYAYSPPVAADRQTGFQTYMPAPANNGIPQIKTTDQLPSSSAVLPARDQKTVSDLLRAANANGTGPSTNQVKPSTSPRQHSKPIRLQNIQNTGQSMP